MMMFMKKFLINSALSTLVLGLLSLPFSLYAHMMVEQHGTLNIVDDKVYIVLSIPMGAFYDADSNKGGIISMLEFTNSRKKLSKKIKNKVVLSNGKSTFSIDGLLLSPEASHTSEALHTKKEKNIEYVTITGRYTITGPLNDIKLNMDLFGISKKHRIIEITSINKKQNEKYTFTLTPQNNSALIVE